MKLGRCLSAALLATTAAAMTSTLVTGCDGAQPSYSYAALWRLEVANEADESARVHIYVGSNSFMDTPLEQKSPFWSGIILLARGERRVYRMTLGPGRRDSSEDNDALRLFGEIHFYDEDSDTPYRSYAYPSKGCGEDPSCWEWADDDTVFYYYDRDDAVVEYLFVESPDRPFYLERDSDDPDLGRIVITFVPSAEDGAESEE